MIANLVQYDSDDEDITINSEATTTNGVDNPAQTKQDSVDTTTVHPKSEQQQSTNNSSLQHTKKDKKEKKAKRGNSDGSMSKLVKLPSLLSLTSDSSTGLPDANGAFAQKGHQEMHQGRQRAFEHVSGHWPIHLYMPLFPLSYLACVIDEEGESTQLRPNVPQEALMKDVNGAATALLQRVSSALVQTHKNTACSLTACTVDSAQDTAASSSLIPEETLHHFPSTDLHLSLSRTFPLPYHCLDTLVVATNTHLARSLGSHAQSRRNYSYVRALRVGSVHFYSLLCDGRMLCSGDSLADATISHAHALSAQSTGTTKTAASVAAPTPLHAPVSVRELQRCSAVDLTLESVRCFLNDEDSRLFYTLSHADTPSSDDVDDALPRKDTRVTAAPLPPPRYLALIRAVDAAVAEVHGPRYYENPQAHVSVAWSLVRKAAVAKSADTRSDGEPQPGRALIMFSGDPTRTADGSVGRKVSLDDLLADTTTAELLASRCTVRLPLVVLKMGNRYHVFPYLLDTNK